MGDIGHGDGGRYLVLCDRAANMVIISGVDIYPAEIERADRPPRRGRRAVERGAVLMSICPERRPQQSLHRLAIGRGG
ncbi:MAG: hypothetical protein Q8K58_06385 [Acidimicrobiales bacterium]|nr:hypothetical protein [Acidimicrobiales bacterium]